MANELAAAAAPSLLTTIADLARDPACDVEKLRALIGMQRDVMAEQARIAFDAAMADAQAEMVPVVRHATNAHTKSRYARLEDIDNAIRPVITRHGFSLTFNNPDQTPDAIVVTCAVAHRDGHMRSYKIAGARDDKGSQGNPNKTPIQAIGSTISYLRRYLTCMIFNVALTNDDTDGNEISPITARQARDLETLLTESGADRAKFLAFLRVDDLADLSSRDYPKARAALEQKKRQMEAAVRDAT